MMGSPMIRVRYDKFVDALYIPLRRGAVVERTVEIDDDRLVDFDSHDYPVGIEILGASHGVHLMDLVEPLGLEALKADFEDIELHPFKAVEYA